MLLTVSFYRFWILDLTERQFSSDILVPFLDYGFCTVMPHHHIWRKVVWGHILDRFGSKNSNNWLFSRFSFSSSVFQSPNWYYMICIFPIKCKLKYCLKDSVIILSIFWPKCGANLVYIFRSQNLTITMIRLLRLLLLL